MPFTWKRKAPTSARTLLKQVASVFVSPDAVAVNVLARVEFCDSVESQGGGWASSPVSQQFGPGRRVRGVRRDAAADQARVALQFQFEQDDFAKQAIGDRWFGVVAFAALASDRSAAMASWAGAP